MTSTGQSWNRNGLGSSDDARERGMARAPFSWSQQGHARFYPNNDIPDQCGKWLATDPLKTIHSPPPLIMMLPCAVLPRTTQGSWTGLSNLRSWSILSFSGFAVHRANAIQSRARGTCKVHYILYLLVAGSFFLLFTIPPKPSFGAIVKNAIQ